MEVVLFGGRQTGVRALGDAWTWDGTGWTQETPATSPPARAYHAMAHDLHRGKTVLFGGTPDGSFPGSLNDTWEWDGASWVQMQPATSPPALASAAMAYDMVRRRVVLFGGCDANSRPQDQTWEWDGVSWRRILTPRSPPARVYPGMTYDQSRQRIVMHGGEMRGDTWQYDGQNWTLVVTENAPPPLSWIPQMAYDALRRRSILFSGASAYDATWELGGDAPTLVSDVDTVSIASGGVQKLVLQPGATHANRPYRVLGSMTGTAPGVTLTGIHIPLQPDLYTHILLGTGNSTVFTKFVGTLDASGTATASLKVAAALPIPLGFELHHAFLVHDAATGWLWAASNPAVVEFR